MDEGIGARMREIRNWRGLSLRTTAGLAGYSASYLSQIENGLAPVDKRSTLEAFAAALRVAPSELGSSFPSSGHPDDAYAPARSALTAVEDALTDIEVGETTRAPVDWASWPPPATTPTTPTSASYYRASSRTSTPPWAASTDAPRS